MTAPSTTGPIRHRGPAVDVDRGGLALAPLAEVSANPCYEPLDATTVVRAEPGSATPSLVVAEFLQRLVVPRRTPQHFRAIASLVRRAGQVGGDQPAAPVLLVGGRGQAPPLGVRVWTGQQTVGAAAGPLAPRP